MKDTLRLTLGILALSWTGVAFSAPPKAVRDKMAEEKVDERVKAAATAVKKACGADVKIELDKDSYKQEDGVLRIKDGIDAVQSFLTGYCSDDESKKEIKQHVKAVKIKFHENDTLPEPEVKGGTLTTYTGPSSYDSDDQMKRALAASLK